MQPQDPRSKHQTTEQQLAEAQARIVELETQLEHQRSLAEALRDSLAMLTTSSDVETVMAQILSYSAAVIPSEAATIILFEGDHGRVANLRGYSPEAVAFFKDYRIPLEVGKFAKSYGDKTYYLIEDTRTTPDWIAFPFTDWIRSSIGVQIILRGESIGLLIVDSAAPNWFRQKDVDNLQAFARYAALALENAQRVDQLELRVSERTAELQAANERLEIQQRQLRYHASLQENVSDAVVVSDTSFHIQSWNHAAERIYGWSAAEAIGRTTAEMMRTTYAEPGDRDHIIRTLHEQGWWHGEVTQHHKDGTDIHVLASITLVKDESGTPFGVVSVNHDISAWRKVDAALRDSEEKFRRLLDAAPIATIISDPDGRINLVNLQAEAIFGFDRTELIGQRVEILVPEYARDQHVRNRAIYLAAPRVRRVGSHLDLFARRKDGSSFPVEIELGFIETKDGMMVMSFVIDITERKRIATELERQRSFLRNVIDVSPNMVFVKDFDGRFVLANPVVARMYNVTPDDLINKTDADFNPSLQEVEHFLESDRRVIASGEALFVEEPLTNSEGETRWLQTTKVPIISEDGKTKYVLGVSTDITERKKTEDALKQALAKEKELGDLKTRFVSMASHEFRTPLATILALTETLIAYRHRLTEDQIDERFEKVKEQIAQHHGRCSAAGADAGAPCRI